MVTAGPGTRSSFAGCVPPDSFHTYVNVKLDAEEYPKPFEVCDMTLEDGPA